jgi:hypothetical protein
MPLPHDFIDHLSGRSNMPISQKAKATKDFVEARVKN